MREQSLVRILIAFSLVIACSSSTKTSGKNSCTPGALQDCKALSGCTGAQRCQADGTWGECSCFQGSGGTNGTGGAGGTPGGSGGGTPGGSGGGTPGGTGPGGAGPAGAGPGGSGGMGGVPPDSSPAGGTSGSGPGGEGGTGGGPQNCPQAQCANAGTAFGPTCFATVQCSCNWCSCDLIACANDPGCTAIVTCALQNGCTVTNPGCFLSGGPCQSVATAYPNSIPLAQTLSSCTTPRCPSNCSSP